MFGFRTMRHHQDDPLLSALEGALRSSGHTRVFNVSLLRTSKGLIAAYRGFAPDSPNAPRAFLCSWDASGSPRTVDLSLFGDRLGLTRVADPKLFTFAGEVYVTFNTGFVSAGENAIYIAQVTPVLGEPQLVVAGFDRQKVEKNWAFGEAPDGSLIGIYQLGPYLELRLSQGRLGEDGPLVFVKRVPKSVSGSLPGPLTLGTQPAAVDGRHLLVAHEKITVRGKRMYFGRAVAISGFGTDDVGISVSPGRLIHSLRDALPHRGKLNKNLLSATYFSGIDIDGEDVVLGYGINDVRHSIARVERKTLWP